MSRKERPSTSSPPKRWNRKSKRVRRAPCSGRARSGPPTTSAPKSASSRHNETLGGRHGYQRDPRENHLPKRRADREDHVELAREGQRAGPEARRGGRRRAARRRPRLRHQGAGAEGQRQGLLLGTRHRRQRHRLSGVRGERHEDGSPVEGAVRPVRQADAEPVGVLQADDRAGARLLRGRRHAHGADHRHRDRFRRCVLLLPAAAGLRHAVGRMFHRALGVHELAPRRLLPVHRRGDRRQEGAGGRPGQRGGQARGPRRARRRDRPPHRPGPVDDAHAHQGQSQAGLGADGHAGALAELQRPGRARVDQQGRPGADPAGVQGQGAAVRTWRSRQAAPRPDGAAT